MAEGACPGTEVTISTPVLPSVYNDVFQDGSVRPEENWLQLSNLTLRAWKRRRRSQLAKLMQLSKWQFSNSTSEKCHGPNGQLVFDLNVLPTMRFIASAILQPVPSFDADP